MIKLQLNTHFVRASNHKWCQAHKRYGRTLPRTYSAKVATMQLHMISQKG